MDFIHKAILSAAAAGAAAVILFPFWDVKWTVRLDYEYYHEKDVPGGRPAATADLPAGIKQADSEVEPYSRRQRAFLLLPPKRPMPVIPPPRSEETGMSGE